MPFVALFEIVFNFHYFSREDSTEKVMRFYWVIDLQTAVMY
jgi:hypothetical protein